MPLYAIASIKIRQFTQKCVFFKQSDIKSYSYFTAGVMAQEDEVVTATVPPVKAEEYVRGDMIPQTTEAPGKTH